MLNWERPQRGMADVAGLNPITPTNCSCALQQCCRLHRIIGPQ
jgi:hypothetical protein